MHICCLILPAIVMIGLPSAGSETTMDNKIEAYDAYSADYVRKGKPSVSVEFAEPQVIAKSDTPAKNGWYQFPAICEWADGTICVTYNAAADATESYGSPRPTMISRDRGKTWTPFDGKSGDSGLLLPNGDRIEVVTPKPYNVADLRLPEPVGVFSSTYGGAKYITYRLTDLQPKLQTIRISRLAKGADRAVTEHAVVNDPQALRYSVRDVFPIIWWGDLRLASDGSILAGIYPGYRLLDDGTMDTKGHVFFYRSTDSGRSWAIQGRILYRPDMTADPKGDKREGFTEPGSEVLADGSVLCAMRTNDGNGVGPMYASRSKDDGKTWSKPRVIAPNGVLPRLLRLENGVLVLASGRPGVQVRFCIDGKGDKWTDPFEMVPVIPGGKGADTCGYTGLLATGPDSFLIAYSHFKHLTESGPRKAILVREVTVKPL